MRNKKTLLLSKQDFKIIDKIYTYNKTCKSYHYKYND